MITTVKSNKGEDVGYIEGNTYYTFRDYNKGQIFHFKGNMIAVDCFVLRRIICQNIREIKVLVTNFERDCFYAVSSIEYFLVNSDKFDYGDGEQRGMPMALWKREYPTKKEEKQVFLSI